jgi:hypothetical protein
MSQPVIERRAALARLAGLCGLALSGDVLAALAKPAATPGLLAPDALALLGTLAQLIIPKTDTPGARDVGAHHTVSHLLKACATPAEQESFVKGLARIDAVAMASGGKHFAALPVKRQVELLHALDEARPPFEAADHGFFKQLKAHTAFAYYTSEAGATRELIYLPVPGGFKGNVPLKKIGRNWAL